MVRGTLAAYQEIFRDDLKLTFFNNQFYIAQIQYAEIIFLKEII